MTLNARFCKDINITLKIIGEEMNVSIVAAENEIVDITTIKDMYAGKTIVTPPLFIWILRSSKWGNIFFIRFPSILYD